MSNIYRENALRTILNYSIGKNIVIVTTTGLIGRHAVEIAGDSPQHFYMAGSLGLASSIGLGLALSNKKIKVIVVEGDGSLLSNFGTLVTIGYFKPINFYHIILDNSVYESSGGMKTKIRNLNLKKIVISSGYRLYLEFKKIENFQAKIKKILLLKGPVFVRLITLAGGKRNLPRPQSLEIFKKRIKKFLTAYRGKRKRNLPSTKNNNLKENAKFENMCSSEIEED